MEATSINHREPSFCQNLTVNATIGVFAGLGVAAVAAIAAVPLHGVIILASGVALSVVVIRTIDDLFFASSIATWFLKVAATLFFTANIVTYAIGSISMFPISIPIALACGGTALLVNAVGFASLASIAEGCVSCRN